MASTASAVARDGCRARSAAPRLCPLVPASAAEQSGAKQGRAGQSLPPRPGPQAAAIAVRLKNTLAGVAEAAAERDRALTPAGARAWAEPIAELAGSAGSAGLAGLALIGTLTARQSL